MLDAGLYRELKRRAASEGRTLTAVVERALRAGLALEGRGRRPALRLPSYDLGPFLTDPAGAPPDPDAPPRRTPR
jgi:plasmid stability protein